MTILEKNIYPFSFVFYIVYKFYKNIKNRYVTIKKKDNYNFNENYYMELTAQSYIYIY